MPDRPIDQADHHQNEMARRELPGLLTRLGQVGMDSTVDVLVVRDWRLREKIWQQHYVEGGTRFISVPQNPRMPQTVVNTYQGWVIPYGTEEADEDYEPSHQSFSVTEYYKKDEVLAIDDRGKGFVPSPDKSHYFNMDDRRHIVPTDENEVILTGLVPMDHHPHPTLLRDGMQALINLLTNPQPAPPEQPR